MNPYNQTLYVVWGNQLLFLISLIFVFHWWMIPVAIMSMYFFGSMSEIAIHRYFTHKSYTTTSFKEKILLAFAFITGQGAVLSWVAVHRTHHAYEDTTGDPHSPQFNPAWKLYLGLFPRKKYKPSIVADLLRSKYSKYFLFENKHYWLMWSLVWALLFAINFYVFFFVVSGAALWYITTATVNIFAHSKTGKKIDLEAAGINSVWLNILSGAGHHNNHHSNPGNYSYKVTNETDVYAYLIEKFFKQ